MGAGKSTIGKKLAWYTGFRFIDLDNYIEAKLGCTVGAFFERYGEAAFRRAELEALREVIVAESGGGGAHTSAPESEAGKGLILSLGGGTVVTPECAALVKEHTRCVYLNCPKTVLLKRLSRNCDKRPLLAGKTPEELDAFVTALVAERESVYKDCAHITFYLDETRTLLRSIEELTDLVLK